MSPRIRNTLIILILIVVAAWGIRWALRARPVLVTVAVVERGQVEATVANTRAGTVKAARRAKVAPSTSGRVIRLEVHEGDQVVADQLLLELWNDDLKARLALAESEVVAAEARRQESCQNIAFLEREARRLADLEGEGFETAEALDKARTAVETGRARCAAMQAAVDVASDQVEVARATLECTRVRAPFSGIVAEVNCELGEIVAPSPVGIPTPPAIELIDPSSPYVSAPIDEVDAPAVRLGMSARIGLDAMPGQFFPGEVARIAPYVVDLEKQARTVEVEVRFRSPETVPSLLPGYSADTEILLSVRDQVLRIPTQAILEGDHVLVLGPDQVLVRRPVRTGVSNWQYTEVLEGLEVGERIVVSVSRDGVVPGVEARAEPASPPAAPR